MQKITIKLHMDDGRKIKIDCSKDGEEIRNKLLEHGFNVAQMMPAMSMIRLGRQLMEG